MQVRPFLRGIRLDRERVPDFEEYPFCIPAVRALEELAFHEAVTFFVGENGTGKSTLLEAIAVACGSCPEGGGRNFQVETRATHSPLWRYLLPLRGPLSPRDGYFLRAESFYNVATAIDELDRVPAPRRLFGTPMAEARTPVLMGRAFSPCCTTGWAEMGCICSTSRRPPCRLPGSWPMLAEMRRLVEAGSQLILSTHSPHPAGVSGQPHLPAGRDRDPADRVRGGRGRPDHPRVSEPAGADGAAASASRRKSATVR